MILVVICVILALILPSSAKENQFIQPENQSTQAGLQENVEKTISHDEIVRLTDNFMNLILQDITEEYKVIQYQSKESLLQAFEEVSTREVAKPFVDFYFYEENDGLYIVPTETPPWFNKQNGYDVVQLDYNKVLIQQENELELYGNYTVEFELTYQDQGWRITKITHR
jgi:type IV secretory pathway component VirB8